jgi:3-dehydroquinate synthase
MIIPVALDARSYNVDIEAGALARAGSTIAPLTRSKTVSVVTDSTVANLHLPALSASLAAAGLTASPLIITPGEGQKNWRTLETVVETLLARGVERGDAVIAFGGGVVGDLTGFAAAILRRGCKFVQIPTTLLAQVDSSVGGKTAINAAAGKNLIGAFHQPAAVIIDPDLLDTLPPRELRAGYAEIAKTALLSRAAFFAWCEGNGAAVLAGDATARVHAIATSVAAKAAIVAADERETGDTRALLNLGHTFGHALEAEAGFGDRLLHGEAVAIGCALAFAFSAERGLCPPDDAARVVAHLAAVGLPVSPKGIATSSAPLIGHMMQDKKMAGGTLAFVLAHGIGDTFVARDVDLTDVAAFLDRQLA